MAEGINGDSLTVSRAQLMRSISHFNVRQRLQHAVRTGCSFQQVTSPPITPVMNIRLPAHATLIFLSTALVAYGQIVFTVNATSTSNIIGYTIGQSVTFTYTLNSGFTGTPFGQADATSKRWYEDTTSDPIIWSAVTGTGLSGTWVRPTSSYTAPYSAVEVIDNGDNDEMIFIASADAADNGLTVAGTPVDAVTMTVYLTGVNFLFSPATLGNPNDYFSGYSGTYAAFGNGEYGAFVKDKAAFPKTANFTVNSVTISGIPEPSTCAAFAGLAALGLAMLYRGKPVD